MNDVSTITQTEFFPGTPQQVYDVFMQSDLHTDFTGADAIGEDKVGSDWTAWDGYISAQVVELDRGAKIVQKWKTREWPEGYEPSTLTITLKAMGSKETELTLVQTDVPTSQVKNYHQGWYDSYWKPLREYLESKQ